MRRKTNIALTTLTAAVATCWGTAAATAAPASTGASVTDRSGRAARVPDQTSSLISEQGCNGQWGVQVVDQTDTCRAYGGYGTTPQINTYSILVVTDNNYGWITYNKNHQQHTREPFSPCTEYDLFTGSTDTGLIQQIHIDGWANETCGTATAPWYVVKY